MLIFMSVLPLHLTHIKQCHAGKPLVWIGPNCSFKTICFSLRYGLDAAGSKEPLMNTSTYSLHPVNAEVWKLNALLFSSKVDSHIARQIIAWLVHPSWFQYQNLWTEVGGKFYLLFLSYFRAFVFICNMNRTSVCIVPYLLSSCIKIQIQKQSWQKPLFPHWKANDIPQVRLGAFHKIIDPEVEDILLRTRLTILRPLSKSIDEHDVADGRL